MYSKNEASESPPQTLRPLNAREQKRHTGGMQVRSAQHACLWKCGTLFEIRIGRSLAAADPDCGISTSSIERRSRRRRCGYRFRSANRRRSGACASQIRATVHWRSKRRRSDVRSRSAVDSGASPHSDIARDAQQPRLSHGSHAHATHGESSPAGEHHQRENRYRNRRIPISITRHWPEAWVSTQKVPSRIHKISARR